MKRLDAQRGSWLLLKTLLWRRRGTVRLGQRHNAVRALQVRLEGLLISGLKRLEQMLCLPTVVTMETPVAPIGEDREKKMSRWWRKSFYLTRLKEKTWMAVHHKQRFKTLKQYLLSCNGSSFRVCIMNAFLDGLCQDSHMSRIVREHSHTHPD